MISYNNIQQQHVYIRVCYYHYNNGIVSGAGAIVVLPSIG
jgi:hypothetical protein